MKKTIAILLAYAILTGPLTYDGGRRALLNWAEKQPDLRVAGQYTAQERDQLANLIADMPAGRGKR